jgi:hypothetical protein
MKCISACSLLLILVLAGASFAQTPSAPPDNQAPTQSKQATKPAKTKPSASKTTTKTPKSGASKKSTPTEDAAYARAYKAGTTEQNKGSAPK